MIFRDVIDSYRSFLSKPLSKKYLGNSLLVSLEQGVGIFLVAVVGILSARYFQPESYGLLSYTYSFVGLFAAFVTLGMDSILIKEIVSNSKNANRIISSAFYVRFLFSLIAYLIVIVNASFFQTNEQIKIMLLIYGWILIFKTLETFRKFFEANADLRVISSIRILALFIFVAIKVAAILMGVNLSTFAIIMVLEILILNIAYAILYFRKSQYFLSDFIPSKTIMSGLLKQSWPLFISSIMVSVFMKIDQVMVQHYLGSRATGIYAASVKISEMWYFVPMAISAALSPSLIDSYNKNKAKFNLRIQQLLSLLLYIAVFVSILVTFLKTEIVQILYGPSYLEAINPLAISVWASTFVFLGVGIHNWIILHQGQKYMTINTILGAVINILCNMILLPRYGIAGAAIATLIAYSFSSFFGYLLFPLTRRAFLIQLKSINFMVLLNPAKVK